MMAGRVGSGNEEGKKGSSREEEKKKICKQEDRARSLALGRARQREGEQSLQERNLRLPDIQLGRKVLECCVPESQESKRSGGSEGVKTEHTHLGEKKGQNAGSWYFHEKKRRSYKRLVQAKRES